MAPKRSSPLDNPPSASSSSPSEEAESEEISDKEEQEQNKGSAESEEEESGDEEEEEEEEEEENKAPPVQNPTTPQPQSSSGSEGSDSESDSGATQPSPTASDFAIKPSVSKPMDDSMKPKKPTSKPSTPAAKSGAKRPAESEEKGKRKDLQKKKRKVSNGDEKDGVVEEKKSAINRLWSEDDEIVILKGMIDYQTKKGAISNADMGAFHEFIKKSLHVDVSKNQLMDKIRRLKKKYQNNAEKGEELGFSKPHELKSFELSKKIWGGGSSNAVDDSINSNNKKARKSVKVSNSLHLPKEDEQEFALQEGLHREVKDLKVEQEDFCSMYPRLYESLRLEKYANLSMSEAEKNFIEESMSLIGSVKAKELEEKWKKFREDEVALYLKRVDLIREQTKMIFDAMKSSNS